MLKISSCGNGQQNINGKWHKTAQINPATETDPSDYVKIKCKKCGKEYQQHLGSCPHCADSE